jgi:hypothetical protein
MVDSTVPPRSRRTWRRGLAVAMALLAFVVMACSAAEIFARHAHLRPRVSLVRPEAVDDFRVDPDGILLYSFGPHVPPCAVRRPGVRPMAFFGSSITYGSGVDQAEALPHQLEERLEGSATGPRCGDDHSQPGYGPQQEWATARDEITRTQPDPVFWELWDPAKYYSVVGRVAFDPEEMVLDGAGVPVVKFVPEAVADVLFRWSYAFQYTAITLAPNESIPNPRRAFVSRICSTMLPDLKRRVAEYGGRLFLLVPSFLDRPFTDMPRDPDTETVVACARTMGFSIVSFAELLSDQHVEDVRFDTCCHLNARGHALLADRIAPLLSRPPPP